VTKDLSTLPQKFWSEVVVALGFVGVVSLVKKKTVYTKNYFGRAPEVDVMITIFCDFANFRRKMALSSKTNVMIALLQKLVVV
jgi:hypothetical protein